VLDTGWEWCSHDGVISNMLLNTITYPVDHPKIAEPKSLCLNRKNCINTSEPVTPVLSVISHNLGRAPVCYPRENDDVGIRKTSEQTDYLDPGFIISTADGLPRRLRIPGYLITN
jgi:hypothetical protein